MENVKPHKYKAGNFFESKFSDNKIEIIKANGVDSMGEFLYHVKVFYKNNLTGAEISYDTFSYYESVLNHMNFFNSKEEYTMSKKKEGFTTYKIFYIEDDDKKAKDMSISLSGIKALARMLNIIKKNNPTRRILTCFIVNENDKIVKSVRFLPEEFKKQQWLTGYKERLLANAKYNYKYEVKINF